jgi:DNA-binding MarR family transcriptional regulator/GNAT superfamily N-acetyltransferase
MDFAEQVRAFNRFYTREIGLLRQGLLGTQFSLTQARILYELGTNRGLRPSDLAEGLDLDPGYLSRLLQAFEKKGLVLRTTSKQDRRSQVLALTPQGRREFKRLNSRSRAEAAEMLSRMNMTDRRRLVESMASIRAMMSGGKPESHGKVALREHRPGDIGWVVARHGELYDQEYRWDSTFEGLVAEVAGKFLTQLDPKRERCWIAEYDGRRVGSIFLVRQSKTVAKLRLLLVEPSARGVGVGTMLVDACLRFARKAGYRTVNLWTNDVLHAARRIYERSGFKLVRQYAHRSFGHDLVGQVWTLKLVA